MIVLGCDTATPATAVALRLSDGSTLSGRHDPQPGERPGHATELLSIAERLLTEAGIGWQELTRIAVGVGPGTFTGLRVGVATARGLAQSLGIEIVAVSSLQALAHRAAAASPRGVLAAIDARRGEVFLGAYAGAGEVSVDTGIGELFAPRALAPEAIGELLGGGGGERGGSAGAGGEGGYGGGEGVGGEGEGGGGEDERWLAVGDGAVRYRPELERLGVQVPEDSSPLHGIDAAAICELALAATPTEPTSVLPDYLRRPDAELALQGAGD
jgi:tRNA threonylcarbamoyladenosine biosynthesis protein TsaB